VTHLERGAGGQFDPAVVEAFRAEFLGEDDELALDAAAA
jgi:HD-GYP domain-containing protein (c-di-GMP phosphodiesterase class II)